MANMSLRSFLFVVVLFTSQFISCMAKQRGERHSNDYPTYMTELDMARNLGMEKGKNKKGIMGEDTLSPTSSPSSSPTVTLPAEDNNDTGEETFMARAVTTDDDTTAPSMPPVIDTVVDTPFPSMPPVIHLFVETLKMDHKTGEEISSETISPSISPVVDPVTMSPIVAPVVISAIIAPTTMAPSTISPTCTECDDGQVIAEQRAPDRDMVIGSVNLFQEPPTMAPSVHATTLDVDGVVISKAEGSGSYSTTRKGCFEMSFVVLLITALAIFF